MTENTVYLMRLNLELASGGFASDRKPARPMDWANVRRRRSAGHYSKSKEYGREYRQAERRRWLAMGIVKPKNDEERAWLAQQGAA